MFLLPYQPNQAHQCQGWARQKSKQKLCLLSLLKCSTNAVFFSLKYIKIKKKVSAFAWKLPLFSIIMFIILWDFLIVSKFSFNHKWNRPWLFVINWYIWVVSRVTWRLKTYGLRKLENIRKILKRHRVIA